jgi:hypothetical protein
VQVARNELEPVSRFHGFPKDFLGASEELSSRSPSALARPSPPCGSVAPLVTGWIPDAMTGDGSRSAPWVVIVSLPVFAPGSRARIGVRS